MQVVFEPNLVLCPNCNHQFANNRINGLALIEATNRIEARKRMYIKLTLDRLESHANDGSLDFTKAKKIILDNFNDLGRDVQTILGLGNEVE